MMVAVGYGRPWSHGCRLVLKVRPGDQIGTSVAAAAQAGLKVWVGQLPFWTYRQQSCPMGRRWGLYAARLMDERTEPASVSLAPDWASALHCSEYQLGGSSR